MAAASRKPHRKALAGTGGAAAGAALGTWIASLINAPSGAAYAIQIIFAALVALAAAYETKAGPDDLPPGASPAPPPAA